MRARGGVRVRITAAAVVMTIATLTLASVALVATLSRSLAGSEDALSRSRAADLAALAEAGSLPDVLAEETEDTVAQVVSDSGAVLAASPNIAGRAPITDGAPVDEPVVRELRGVPDPDESNRFRIWSARAETATGPVTVYVGHSLETVTEVTSRLALSLLVGVPLLVVLLGTGTWLLVGRTLRPVEGIRSEVARISHEHLDRRVPQPGYDDEVGRLASTMNEMLERLEASAVRQRDFVANAAHELKTPLASSRTALEVALAHDEDAEWRDVASDLLADGERMDRLVQDLLFLARHEETAAAMAAPVDLDDVVLAEATAASARSGVPVDTREVSAGPVLGRREELGRLVRNLLDNATAYARERVQVELGLAGRQVVLVVSDDGPGVAEADRERVFERFYRGDPSRSRSGPAGAGLGLAIARAVAEGHGGTLRLEPDGLHTAEQGARFVLRLPRA